MSYFESNIIFFDIKKIFIFFISENDFLVSNIRILKSLLLFDIKNSHIRYKKTFSDIIK